MIRFLATAVLLASGCSVVRVDEVPMDGSLGAVEIKAIKRDDPDELTWGYAFLLKGPGTKPVWITAEPSGPVLLPNLKPGPYTVEVRGKGISPKRFEVDIRAGVRTSIAVLRKNVKRNERIEALAAATGKAILYSVGFVGYVLIVLPIQACLDGDTGDDDDEDDDWSSFSPSSDHRPCRSRSAKPAPAPRGYRLAAPSGYRRK